MRSLFENRHSRPCGATPGQQNRCACLRSRETAGNALTLEATEGHTPRYGKEIEFWRISSLWPYRAVPSRLTRGPPSRRLKIRVSVVRIRPRAPFSPQAADRAIVSCNQGFSLAVVVHEGGAHALSHRSAKEASRILECLVPAAHPPGCHGQSEGPHPLDPHRRRRRHPRAHKPRDRGEGFAQDSRPSEAKIRQAQGAAHLEGLWRSLRAGSQRLTHKQTVALSGELYRDGSAPYLKANDWRRRHRRDEGGREAPREWRYRRERR